MHDRKARMGDRYIGLALVGAGAILTATGIAAEVGVPMAAIGGYILLAKAEQ